MEINWHHLIKMTAVVFSTYLKFRHYRLYHHDINKLVFLSFLIRGNLLFDLSLLDTGIVINMLIKSVINLTPNNQINLFGSTEWKWY